MAQKRITVDQVESGKGGVANLGFRLDGFDSTITQVNTDLTNSINSTQGEVDALEQAFADQNDTIDAQLAQVNESVMAMASSPVSTPIFNDIQAYTVQASDITAGTATTITIPNGKKYHVGKGNLLVLRNGVPQVLANGDYTEETQFTIQYSADVLMEGDVITFIIGVASKFDYAMAITYYAAGDDAGRIETVTYTGDINRVYTYTYTAEGLINTEAVDEDGKTTTKTFSYTDGKLAGITAVVV